MKERFSFVELFSSYVLLCYIAFMWMFTVAVYFVDRLGSLGWLTKFLAQEHSLLLVIVETVSLMVAFKNGR